MNLEKLLTLAVAIAAVLFIAVVTVGTLAIPVVLAVFHSRYWLFLYVGYASIIAYVLDYIVKCKENTPSKR